MRELGEDSAEAHAALGRRLAGSSVDAVLLYGEEMGDAWRTLSGTPAEARSYWSADFDAFAARARAFLREGDLLLIKGSRGLELERLLPYVAAVPGQEARCS
jgi:UDP-N-acetylmuramoyl-tripeptide--D-alanyl-D-alanine ligase